MKNLLSVLAIVIASSAFAAGPSKHLQLKGKEGGLFGRECLLTINAGLDGASVRIGGKAILSYSKGEAHGAQWRFSDNVMNRGPYYSTVYGAAMGPYLSIKLDADVKDGLPVSYTLTYSKVGYLGEGRQIVKTCSNLKLER